MDQAESNRKMAILSLTFGQKLKIAFKLSRSRLLPYFLAYLLLCLAFCLGAGIITALSALIFPIFYILMIPLILAMFYLGLGFCLSVLNCLDGKEAKFEFATLLLPLKQWQRLLPITCALFGLGIVAMIALTILSIIPFLGWIAAPVAMYLLMIVAFAYYFYLADYLAQPLNRPVGELVTAPLRLITPSMNRWLPALGAYFLVMIPCMILTGISVFMLLAADPYLFDSYGYGAYGSDLNMGMFVGGAFFSLLSLLTALLGGIFTLFMFAIAYRQSQIDQEFAPRQSQFAGAEIPHVVPHAPPAPQNPQAPHNPGAPGGFPPGGPQSPPQGPEQN